MEDLTIRVNGKDYHVRVEESESGKILVRLNGDVFEIEPEKSKEAAIFDILKKKEVEGEGSGIVKAPLPGIISEVNVKKGQKVKEGDSLIKIIAMKMENDILAKRSGIIKEIKVKKNDKVNKDDLLVVIG